MRPLGTNIWRRICFRHIFAYAVLMFQGAPSPLKVVVRCKGCGENIPAPVETQMPACAAHRCDVSAVWGAAPVPAPRSVFQGRLVMATVAEAVRSAGW